jgi:CubicO group peptidase (beta-lactamase class C family)
VCCAAVACGDASGTEPSHAADAADAAATPDAGASDAGDEPARLDDLLDPIRAGAGVPALAALVMRGGLVVGRGAVGVRKLGDPTPVTDADAWYLGTAVQSMTATLAALLVEDGKVAWSSTLGDVLGDVPMHASYKTVSLEALLGHRGGAPATIPAAVSQAMGAAGNAQARRDEAVRAILAVAPEAPPGAKVLVSDAGYLMAAVMLERALGESWEDLLRARVLDPLGMSGCRYDAEPATGAIVEPWGHAASGGALQAIEPGSAAEAPPAFGPAGRLRCPLRDWAQLTAIHLAGARHETTKLLSPTSFEKLQSPSPLETGTQAMGWSSVSRPWSGEVPALVQGSRNPLFFALAWVVPSKNLVFLVATNQADRTALAAADQVVGRLVERFVAR